MQNAKGYNVRVTMSYPHASTVILVLGMEPALLQPDPWETLRRGPLLMWVILVSYDAWCQWQIRPVMTLIMSLELSGGRHFDLILYQSCVVSLLNSVLGHSHFAQ